MKHPPMREKLLSVMLLFVIIAEAQESADSQFILRSTTSVSTVQTNEQVAHILQQSTGQASVSGTYEAGSYLLSQGFVQNSVWMNIVSPDDEVDLEAKVFPNPFVDYFNVSFLETIKQPIQVFVYSEIGRELQNAIYDESQELSISLEHLPPGKYYIKVAANNKLFVDHLVKTK